MANHHLPFILIINKYKLLLIKCYYFQNSYNNFMKICLLLILLIACTSAFQIRVENEEMQVETVGYPFYRCDQIGMSFTSFTLDQKPTLNINLTATVVGKAKKDLAFNRTVIEISVNFVPLITVQEDYNVTYKNGETTNFAYTYEIPQYQQKGSYMVVFQFINTDDNREGCIFYTYNL